VAVTPEEEGRPSHCRRGNRVSLGNPRWAREDTELLDLLRAMAPLTRRKKNVDNECLRGDSGRCWKATAERSAMC